MDETTTKCKGGFDRARHIFLFPHTLITLPKPCTLRGFIFTTTHTGKSTPTVEQTGHGYLAALEGKVVSLAQLQILGDACFLVRLP
jgi:hypothetical protein